MKYFENSLYRKLNHRIAPGRLVYRLRWRRNVQAYETSLSSALRGAPDGVRTLADSPMHDARFVSMDLNRDFVEVLMDCTGTPLAPASSANIRFLNAKVLQPPTIGDSWLYEELSRGDERAYRIEALCADGGFSVEFDDADVARRN